MPLFNPSTSSGTVSSSIAATSQIAGTTTSVALLTANASRKSCSFFNTSSGNLYIGLSDVSATKFIAKVASGGYYELPVNFTGTVYGVFDNATGTVDLCEFS